MFDFFVFYINIRREIKDLIMTKNTSKHVDLSNARTEEQTNVMLEIIKNGDDPFSEENLKKYHKLPILEEAKWWIVTTNQWPYKNSDKQLLFILRHDAPTLEHIPSEAFRDLLILAQKYANQFKIKGGALCMRFGETSLSGATVTHIHAQLIQPKKGEVVKFWIGQETK